MEEKQREMERARIGMKKIKQEDKILGEEKQQIAEVQKTMGKMLATSATKTAKEQEIAELTAQKLLRQTMEKVAKHIPNKKLAQTLLKACDKVEMAEVENPAQNMLAGAARVAAASIAIVDFIFVNCCFF